MEDGYQLELNFDVDPVTMEIENLINEPIQTYRAQKRTYENEQVTIRYYWVLTETAVYDVSLSNDPYYNVIFGRHDRQRIESSNRMFVTGISPIIERVFGKEATA